MLKRFGANGQVYIGPKQTEEIQVSTAIESAVEVPKVIEPVAEIPEAVEEPKEEVAISPKKKRKINWENVNGEPNRA